MENVINWFGNANFFKKKSRCFFSRIRGLNTVYWIEIQMNNLKKNINKIENSMPFVALFLNYLLKRTNIYIFNLNLFDKFWFDEIMRQAVCGSIYRSQMFDVIVYILRGNTISQHRYISRTYIFEIIRITHVHMYTMRFARSSHHKCIYMEWMWWCCCWSHSYTLSYARKMFGGKRVRTSTVASNRYKKQQASRQAGRQANSERTMYTCTDIYC